MKIRLAILCGLLHLAIALLGPLAISPGKKLGRVLSEYGSLTGTTTDFKFFAPSVGAPVQSVFEITDSRGRVTTEDLREANREVVLRVGNIVDSFGQELADASVRRSLAASLANYVGKRHPEMRSLRVRLREFALPTMREFRQGNPGHWNQLYQASFRAED